MLSLSRPALTGEVEKADPSCLRLKCEADDTDSRKMETPLGRQTLHCDNCYLITGGKHSHGSPFFHTVSTLWKSKYFSDYPPCALIHMVRPVCRRRCYRSLDGFFRIGRTPLQAGNSGTSAPKLHNEHTKVTHHITPGPASILY